MTFDVAVVTLILNLLPGQYQLIIGRYIDWEYMCGMSNCNLDLTFDLVVMTLAIRILSRLYLPNQNVGEVDTWHGYWTEAVGEHYHGDTLIGSYVLLY